MTSQLNDIKKLEQEAISRLELAKSPQDLEAWRVAYIGRKGAIPRLLREVKNIAPEERKEVGQAANALRQVLEAAYDKKQQEVGDTQPITVATQKDGVTELPPGHLHPLTITSRRLTDIFAGLGFLIVEGPEIEEAKYNFDALNISFEHPARAETDTFYVDVTKRKLGEVILRTHVSPLQIRGVMEHDLKPPFRMMYLGRCFRAEKADATHESTFHQFEFMMVGEELTLADLKGIIEQVYSTFFGKSVNIRFRPSYFPFVEPGFEIDISCIFCEGKGCRICKNTGWIELAGAGIVHPNVLRNIGIDPSKYTGLACGAAIDRLAMLRHNISDIRLFWSGDLRFLKQFS